MRAIGGLFRALGRAPDLFPIFLVGAVLLAAYAVLLRPSASRRRRALKRGVVGLVCGPPIALAPAIVYLRATPFHTLGVGTILVRFLLGGLVAGALAGLILAATTPADRPKGPGPAGDWVRSADSHPED
jgi:hypothetical protein